MKINILILLLSVFFISCSVSDEELKKGWWKYGGGQHIGDVLTFSDLNLKNDTIFRGNKKIGVIVDRDESLFGLTSRKIFIRPLIETTDPYEESFKLTKTHFPDSEENYINPYPKDLGVYHQK
jgi:hypothetical protein